MGNNLDFGKSGEDEAVKYLENNGYKIIERNFRCKIGELDIIAFHNNSLIFIEVKSRHDVSRGAPSEAINRKKLHSIIRTSQYYMQTHKNLPQNIRYDAVEVFFENGYSKTNHIENITM